MKKHLLYLSIALLGFSIPSTSAQVPFATLKKNINVQAKGLLHELNASKDTLLLKSDKKINYVYSINHRVKRELSFTVNANNFEVPLNHLTRGRHVFVVVQSPLRIVFVVNILKDGLAVIKEEDDSSLLASKND